MKGLHLLKLCADSADENVHPETPVREVTEGQVRNRQLPVTLYTTITNTRAVDRHTFFVDPDLAVFLNPDPDPAAFKKRNRIQLFLL